MYAQNQFGHCKHCGKMILWVRTKAGRSMPVDPEAISYCKPAEGEKAKEKIVTQEGEVISANRAVNQEFDGIGYISHFATCKNYNRKRSYK